jgi:hypothetical protein
MGEVRRAALGSYTGVKEVKPALSYGSQPFEDTMAKRINKREAHRLLGEHAYEIEMIQRDCDNHGWKTGSFTVPGSGDTLYMHKHNGRWQFSLSI